MDKQFLMDMLTNMEQSLDNIEKLAIIMKTDNRIIKLIHESSYNMFEAQQLLIET